MHQIFCTSHVSTHWKHGGKGDNCFCMFTAGFNIRPNWTKYENRSSFVKVTNEYQVACLTYYVYLAVLTEYYSVTDTDWWTELLCQYHACIHELCGRAINGEGVLGVDVHGALRMGPKRLTSHYDESRHICQYVIADMLTDIFDYHCCVRYIMTLLPLFFFCTCIVYCILLLVAIVNFYLRRIYDIWYDMHWWQRRGRIWSQDSPAIVDKPRDACQDYCVNSAVLKHWYSMVSSFEIAYWELAIWSRRRDEGGGWCVTETSASWILGMNPAPKQRASLILR